MKENGGGDNLAVAWQQPGGELEVIGGLYLSPAEVQHTNVALGGTATQSSTFVSSFEFDASNAIDGNTNGDDAANAMTHTNNDLEAWWEVDLGASHYIDLIRIWNRTDCCSDRLSDFYVLVSDAPFTSTNLNTTLNQAGVDAFYFTGAAGTTENFFTRANGRYVRVQLSGQNFLQLAEVEIFGQPSSAFPAQADLTVSLDSADRNFGTAAQDSAAGTGYLMYSVESIHTRFSANAPHPDNDNHFIAVKYINDAWHYDNNNDYFPFTPISTDLLVASVDFSADSGSVLQGANAYVEGMLSGYATGNISITADLWNSATNDGEFTISGSYFVRNSELPVTNVAPVITDPGAQTTAEGATISLDIEATDGDGDELTYSASGLPGTAVMNATTGLIEGYVEAGDAGNYSVTVVVNDNTDSSTLTFDWTITAAPGGWVDYADETASRLSYTANSFEKDTAVGDLNNDGWDDVVVVHKTSFDIAGQQADTLLMNVDGVLVDQTATYAPAMLTNLTDARDVLLNDVDSDGWLDIIIATTFEDPPALYRNLGNDGAGNWLGFANESGRLPATFDTSTVQFCAITAGDVNGDGHEDLYFANYAMDGGAKDVLLINDGNGNFTEESQARLGDYRWSAFGTSAQIIDMDNDGDNEIVKLSAEYGVHPWGHAGIFTLFNDGAGNFTSYDEIPSADPYMFWIDDLNNDGLNDLFVQDDAQDYVQLGSGFTANSEVTFNQSNLTAVQTSDHGGNFRFADLDGDGDLDMGIADVDTMWPPCDTGADSFRKFTLLINDGTGQMSDPYGGAKHVWSQNTFDFDFIDIDRDGNLDIFAAQCDGYAVYMNTAAPTINQPPILTNTADQNSNEGDTISLTISATDADGDTLTYSATGLPTELSINSTTGEIAGTLGFFSEGSYTVNVTVTDGTITDSDSFTWTISGSNQAPTVANPGDQTSSEGDAVSLQISGSDPDGDGLTYSATGLPTDLSIDSAGLIAGTLGYESAGSYSVTVTVSDGVLTDSETFNWTINNTNRAPSLINPGAQANDEDDTVSLNITASDADGDTLTYSATGLPAGLSLNTTTGEITGTATPAGDFTVIVTVSDGTASADATFDWTVTAVAPPTEDNETVYFSITGSGFVGASVSFVDEDIVAYDTINDEWSLYFDGSDVGLNVSGNADIDAVHVREDGSILFSIRATETLPDVGEITNADLILFTPTSLGETTAGTFSMYLDGSDVGLTGGGEDITAVYEMANGDLIISTVGTNNVGTLGNLRDEDLLRFSGSYGDTTSGTWSLYFDGSDADMLASTEEFYGVSVDENSSEIFLSNRGTFDLGGITGDASDVAVCQSAVTGENSSCSYALFLDGGAIGLDNEVIDGLSVLRTTSVPGNQAPIINNPGAQTNTEGDGISLTITATDGDGDTLTFSQTGLPTGLSINSSSGEISGTATTAGDYSVTVSVDDGTESRSASFDWEIVEPNVAPVVTNPGAQANDEGETISLAIVATDGNSDALTYSASDLPTGLAINASTGEISGVLNYESAGSYTVSIDVTDGIETSSVSFSWTVNDVEPPAGSATIYVSSTSSGNAGGLSFVDEDIIAYDPTTDSWSMYFDGSDVGFGGNSALDTSAFHVRADGSILLAIRQDNEVADLGIVENSDILLFTPTSTGDTTAGTFSIYLDGSDVDLSSGGESITAISELSNGDLVISTIGSNNVGTLGTQRDEDLLLFSGTYGENTSGTWSFYFDGSDAELTDSTEEIHAVSVDPITGDIVMVMRGAFTVTGASGGASDLVGCYAPTTGENSSCAYAIYATGVELGINGENIDGLSIGN
ncbi:MAG: putative Ig domain-containing protein [Chloroflexota bacterium]